MPGSPALRGRKQDDAAVHEQDQLRDEDGSEAKARAAAALVVLARLMGRLAGREHFAASSAREGETDEEAE